jgi:hypothetical protein
MTAWRRGAPRTRSRACWKATVSGWSRERDNCRQQGIASSTLDNYRRRYDPKPTRFARVKVPAQASEPGTAFALVLRNGCRIESAWNFRDADLSRLIRVAEAE